MLQFELRVRILEVRVRMSRCLSQPVSSNPEFVAALCVVNLACAYIHRFEVASSMVTFPLRNLHISMSSYRTAEDGRAAPRNPSVLVFFWFL